MLPAAITTEEFRKLTAYSKAAIVDLEREGVIQRKARDTWPMPDTLVNIVGNLREKVRRGASSADARWRTARAREIEIRTAEREGKLISIDEAQGALEDVTGFFIAELSGLTAAATRDLVVRRQIDETIFAMRTRIADHFQAQARSLAEH